MTIRRRDMKETLCILLVCFLTLAFAKHLSSGQQPKRRFMPISNDDGDDHHHHPKSWVIKVVADQNLSENETLSKASRIASQHGCRVVSKVGNLKGYFLIQHDGIDHPSSRKRREDIQESLSDHPEVEWFEFQRLRHHKKRLQITDPLFGDQWHIHSTRGIDLNVLPVWESGYSGKGVTISIVDDSLEWRHIDLGQRRYLAEASYDWNAHDDDPSPSFSDDTHGTSCGGLAFSGMNNNACGVGIAYEASFSGQRLISGMTIDATEASALSYKIDQNAIFSASWGPVDDGMRKEGPGTLLKRAMADSIQNGRKGKGTIYVWAGGNGGSDNDNVNYDGYANSIHTIAVASLDGKGRKSSYSEEGACLVVSCPSSPPSITTIGVHDHCTNRFGGTSASAPMIAGVVALMLEANPDLDWREVQNALIKTAIKNDPFDPDWIENGASLHVNHKYGFGLVDAKAAVDAALDPLMRLPPAIEPVVITTKESFSISAPNKEDRKQPSSSFSKNKQGIAVSFQVMPPEFIVEHVELSLHLDHPHRGDLAIVLVSPAGTQSVLAKPHKDRHANYEGWTFTSMRHWNESSAGEWLLRVIPNGLSGAVVVGQFKQASLTVHGH